MEGEREKPIYHKIKEMSRFVAPLITLAGLAVATTTAFSRPVRREIRSRAGRRSELSGRYDIPLDASHIIHSRQYPQYDSPLNGLYLTVEEHLLYHEQFASNPRLIGLSARNNRMAILSLRNRTDMALHENGVEPLISVEKTALMEILIRLVGEQCKKMGIRSPFDSLFGM